MIDHYRHSANFALTIYAFKLKLI